MDESAAPFGESDTKRSARKKNFELPTGSPADFFTYISPRLALSKIQLIRWGSNLRKVRWKVKGRGKSGGIRTIYYYHEDDSLLLMIYVYEKSKTEDLTPKQIEMLRKTFVEG